jgi:hypothetical protein
MHRNSRRRIRRSSRLALRAGLAAALAGVLSWYVAVPGDPAPLAASPAAAFIDPGPAPVAEAVYNLGDTAYHDPNITTPIELAAVVHYPAHLGDRPHPLIVIEHGLWWTCADRQAEQVVKTTPTPPPTKGGPPPPPALVQAYAELAQWPCRPGVAPIPSDAGYDYLAASLASHGFIVVSISVNAINAAADTAAVTGDEYAARADMINEHLSLWRELVTTGGGPLADALVDPSTGQRARVDFQGRVDLSDVGTIGHSRGGEAVMYQAADTHRGAWPPGVRIRAVFTLGPVYDGSDGANRADTLVTNAAVAGMTGTCDASGGDSQDYFTYESGRTEAGLYNFSVVGAEHNYFNTQWSPDSGQVMASDDAVPAQNAGPGRCTDHVDGGSAVELTETQQRQAAIVYTTAYFRRYLLGDSSVTPVLTGAFKPLADVTNIVVSAQP